MKKHNKKLGALSLLLALLVTLAASPASYTAMIKAGAATGSETCGDGLSWALDSAGTLTVSGSGTMDDYSAEGDEPAPWYANAASIKKVVISGGAENIGSEAFYGCENLTGVSIADTVTSIGMGAFASCTSLASMQIPDSVVRIDADAFAETALYDNENNWKNGVLYIGKFLIAVDEEITGTLTVKSGTLAVADGAIVDCEEITSVSIPDSVVSLGDSPFSGCPSLTSISVAAGNNNYSSDGYGVLFDKDKTELIKYPAANTRKGYTVPASVETIDGDAFEGSSKLESVILSEGLTTLGASAFADCAALKEISIPDSVETVYDSAFSGCVSLSGVAIGSGVNTIDGYAFINCNALKSVTIPVAVAEIGEYAFGYTVEVAEDDIGDDEEESDDGEEDAEDPEEPEEPEEPDAEPKKIDGFKIFCYAGTAGETYAKDNGFDYELLVYTGDRLELIENSSYTLEGGYVTGVRPGTSYNDFVTQFVYQVTVKDPEGGAVNTGIICTGYTVSAGDFSAVTAVKGDVSGDGAADSSDAALVLNCDAFDSSLEDAYLLAADMNGDGEADVADAAVILRTDAGK